MRTGLTILILAKNEEKDIDDCLRSCRFADEIILVDDHSTDQTAAIAKHFGARVVTHSLEGDWARQRNFAVRNASCKWVMFVDSDERISPELAQSIRYCIARDKPLSGLVCRHNYFMGASHGMLKARWIPRLFPVEGLQVKGRVHETFCSPCPETKLPGELKHYPYADWEEMERKNTAYSTLAARKMMEEGKPVRVFDVMVRPFAAFLKFYIVNLGFLDGRVGLALSLSCAHYTMMKYVKFMSLNGLRN